MEKSEILNNIALLADSTLPSSGACSEQERADFANELIRYVQDTLIPDRPTKPSIRF